MQESNDSREPVESQELNDSEEPVESREITGTLVVEKCAPLALLVLGALAIGYWWALPPGERLLKSTLVEISTLIPLFSAMIAVAFEVGGSIIMSFLVAAFNKWEKYQILRKARLYAIQKEKEEREKMVAEARAEAYEEGKAEGIRIAKSEK